MSDLITPDDLPRWAPGETTVDSVRLGWEGVRTRGYRYTPLDVPIPAMREYMIVVYKSGATTMNRRITGDWRNEPVAPGCVSLLTHAAQSHWRWTEDIEVTHVYLSPQTMADVAAEAYERHIKDVELRDILKADDPVLMGIAASLAREAQAAGLGGRFIRGVAQESRPRPYSAALRRRRLPGASPIRRAVARPTPVARSVPRRKSGWEPIAGGTRRRRAAQRVSFHTQIPRRVRLPAACLCHA